MNAKDFEGTVELGAGANRFIQAIDMQKGTLVVNENVSVTGYKAGGSGTQTFTYKLGGVQGAGQLGAGTWNVGYAGHDDTFAGQFAGSVNKYGEGRWVLTGASTGTLNVYEGTVWANCTTAATTSGGIVVRSGATLKGNGQVQNLTVKSGATLGTLYRSPAITSQVGTLTVNGNLTTEAGAVIEVRTRSTASKTTTDVYSVKGNATLTSPVFNLSQLSQSYSYVPGQDLRIIDCTGTLTINGTPTLQPAVPMPGYEWDTSSLATEGILRVRPLEVVTLSDVTNLIRSYLTDNSDGRIRMADVTALLQRYLK
jgi:autotransporter-associated beta strand protein